tara:strand:- start:120 stop:635 length:516 start_codon:yes stop_codon:yes gene_type:complete
MRRVFGKYHDPSRPFSGNNLSASSCLSMFQTALDLRDPKFSPFNKSRKLRDWHLLESTGHFLSKYPVIFCEVVLALDKSTKRVQNLPKETPELVVEGNFAALGDTDKNQKLAQALPEGSRGKREGQIRKHISNTNKIIAKWNYQFVRENSSGQFVVTLSEDGQSVDVFEQR